MGEKEVVFSGDLAAARPGFEAMAAAGDRVVTPQDHTLYSLCRPEHRLPAAAVSADGIQDRTLYGLCRPERLLDMIRQFTVFDGGRRKVARHQQEFTVRRAKVVALARKVAGQDRGEGVPQVLQGNDDAQAFSASSRSASVGTMGSR
ncbi:hypothetical protein [Candidatus Synechococcus spongiarum]|uniref:Type I restriction-modification system,restriction subunit R n=1 Tax=Candidatus Synechococcus spongiarum TaxID=431041 RepID=A0A164Z3M8_9SYNE|nr:hypothetical protein [Candidatus Synechococcus spongiarum]SAY38476.1 Type I restriction-modification system,restriction subunit R (EC 3.1.21.3) [Candidatus Synechococcus spongiarum]